MKRTMTSIAVLTLGLVLNVGVVGAQVSVDPALLAPVERALENTRALDSLRISTQSLTESSATFGDLSIQNTQQVDLLRNDDAWNAVGTVSLMSALPVIGELNIGGEFIRYDDETYIRFTNLPDALPIELPQTWTTTESLEAGGGFLPLPTTTDALFGPLNLPITVESVTEMSVLPVDEIGGQAMTVTQVSLDPSAVLESGAAGLLSANVGPGIGGGALPGGLTPPDGLQQRGEIVPPEADDIQVTLAIYVGVDDALVHRIYLLVNIADSEDGSRPAGTVTTISDFSNFGEPVDIVLPELGS